MNATSHKRAVRMIPLVTSTRPAVPIVDLNPLAGHAPYPKLGQYTMIWARGKRRVNRCTFIVAISGAYDAYGLIGPEHNGIVVLNETTRDVVADQIAPHGSGSGYFGPSVEQAALFAELLTMPGPAFIQYLCRCTRFRGSGTLG